MFMNKWFAVAGLALALAAWAPKAAAQDDNGAMMDPDAAMSSQAPIEFIAPAEVKKMVEEKATTFALVDTQPEEAYQAAHVPGAINYPWVDQVKPPIALPRNKMLILYCPCNHDEDSIDMTKKLRAFGYLNTKVLEGGWYKWVELKYPVVGDDVAGATASVPSASKPAEPPAAPAVAIQSGRPVGAVTPSFRVLDVTGQYKGQSTCYVCEYGNAPTILAFFRKTGDQTADLIVKLNQLAEQMAKKNLKAVAVLVEGPDSKAWLEKLAQDKSIKIPLVVLVNGPKDLGVRLYKINTDADNTFLVNNKRAVIANFANVNDTTFQEVADASSKMLGGQ
jgi:rhodanese-related sulfurtransferase